MKSNSYRQILTQKFRVSPNSSNPPGHPSFLHVVPKGKILRSGADDRSWWSLLFHRNDFDFTFWSHRCVRIGSSRHFHHCWDCKAHRRFQQTSVRLHKLHWLKSKGAAEFSHITIWVTISVTLPMCKHVAVDHALTALDALNRFKASVQFSLRERFLTSSRRMLLNRKVSISKRHIFSFFGADFSPTT